jgi:AAA+ ATPase superfamily predicted ATPase
MVAIVGRRRVGKTYLVRQVYAGRIDFELTGLQHGNKETQLQNFIFTMGKYFPDYQMKEKPDSWLKAFHFLTQALESLNKSGKIVVFLDELPWLGTKRSGFTTGLGYFSLWPRRKNIANPGISS